VATAIGLVFGASALVGALLSPIAGFYVAGLTGGTLGALLARLNLSLVPLTGAVFALAASLVALRAIRPGA